MFDTEMRSDGVVGAFVVAWVDLTGDLPARGAAGGLEPLKLVAVMLHMGGKEVQGARQGHPSADRVAEDSYAECGWRDSFQQVGKLVPRGLPLGCELFDWCRKDADRAGGKDGCGSWRNSDAQWSSKEAGEQPAPHLVGDRNGPGVSVIAEGGLHLFQDALFGLDQVLHDFDSAPLGRAGTELASGGVHGKDAGQEGLSLTLKCCELTA
jgi:hypothetical protein